MEGVPVKLSERYRTAVVEPPPSPVLRTPQRAARLANDVRYDFSLETNVLRRLDEWREARIAEKERRDERIRLAEEAKREAEEAAATLQRLHLAEVTYPSAEDIGDESPESPESASEPSNATIPPAEEISEPPSVPIASDGILQPTRAPFNARVDLLDDLDPIAKLHSKRNKFSPLNGLRKKNVENMTFSDFENDTSSPFDNLELKSINDLELLAQVLGNQQPSAEVNGSVAVNEPPHSNYPMTNAFSPASYDRVDPFSSVTRADYFNCDNEQSQYSNYNMNDPRIYYAPNYNYSDAAYRPVRTNYPMTNENLTYEGVNNENDKFAPYHGSADVPFFYNMTYPTYTQYGNVVSEIAPALPNIDETAAPSSESDGTQNLLKSRSKSVPDIVKELDEEVAEARLRSRERSHNCSPAPSRQTKPDASSPQRTRVEKLPDPFDMLSPKLQIVCKSINGMGFPIDRVARACKDIGDDDKKIIEYLLLLGQLMDLGFSESKVAKALLQHDCNRDKALDELIS